MHHVRLLACSVLVLATAGCGDGPGGPGPNPGDTVAPFVTALLPAPLERNVLLDAAITVTFSEPINPATVGVGSFLVRRSFDTVPGGYVFGDSTVGFEPDGLLESGTAYSVTLTRGVRDPAGNQLARDTAWSFTAEGRAVPASRR
jgi:hypothetical protein